MYAWYSLGVRIINVSVHNEWKELWSPNENNLLLKYVLLDYYIKPKKKSFPWYRVPYLFLLNLKAHSVLTEVDI